MTGRIGSCSGTVDDGLCATGVAMSRDALLHSKEEHHAVKFDGQAVISRCSVRSVHEVISRFDCNKRKLVNETGFGGLLHFPPLRQMNHRFSVWLMSKVDEESQALVLDDRRIIRFSKVDVGLVFGIPCSGKRVVDRSARKEKQTTFSRNIPGLELKDQRSIKAAQEVLDLRVWEGDEQRGGAFIQDSVRCFSYVIQRLMDAVIKLKADMMRKIRVSNLTGCSLFLQVLYLDSMDLGLWNNRPGLLPRVRFFTTDRMRFMIDTDSSTPEDGRIDVDYGVSQLRCPTEVCYSWAKEAQCVQGMAESSSQSDLLDGTVLMTRELKIPTGVAGPLYLAFLDHRRKLMEASDRQWKSFMRAVVSIVNTSMYDSPVL
ncbi:hypothetical protein QOZ80_2BG0191930 [Eleusine coracana subsp. coracana]|nr:hypothetical protein QOZ80_2BG0191930 [Eleusine coracana subsp. coracana]